MNKKIQGFTLVEVLLVIGIIAILASVVIIAINPARQMAQARNTQRWSNVNTILNSVHQYIIDNSGTMPSGISSSSFGEICYTGTGGVASTSCGSYTNLWQISDGEKYIVSFPRDPGCPNSSTCASTTGVGYQIKRSVNGRITVKAPGAELGEVIQVTR